MNLVTRIAIPSSGGSAGAWRRTPPPTGAGVGIRKTARPRSAMLAAVRDRCRAARAPFPRRAG